MNRLCKHDKLLSVGESKNPIDKVAVEKILDQYQHRRTDKLKIKIIEHLKPLISIISKKFIYLGESYNDLIQIGTIGLLKSIDSFKKRRQHNDFVAYAAKKIVGEIKHYFRDSFKLIKIPRKYLKTYYDMNRYIQDYLQKHKGRSPTVKEIAKAIKANNEIILETMEIMHICSMINLDKPIIKSMGNEPIFSEGRKDYLVNNDLKTFEEKIDNLYFLDKIMKGLTFRERKILQLYYGDNMTQKEIASRYKVSQVCIYRIIEHAVDKCRSSITREKHWDKISS